MNVLVKIVPTETDVSVQKVADAELHFEHGDLDGLKLVGFAIWQRRGRAGYDVTFPFRDVVVHGRRRRYPLLRASRDSSAEDRVRDLVLRALASHQAIVNADWT